MQSHYSVTVENGRVKFGADYLLDKNPTIGMKKYDFENHHTDNDITAHGDSKNLDIMAYSKKLRKKEPLTFTPHFPDDIKTIGELLTLDEAPAQDIAKRLKEIAPDTFATWFALYNAMLKGEPVVHRDFIEIQAGLTPHRTDDKMKPEPTEPKKIQAELMKNKRKKSSLDKA